MNLMYYSHRPIISNLNSTSNQLKAITIKNNFSMPWQLILGLHFHIAFKVKMKKEERKELHSRDYTIHSRPSDAAKIIS